MLLLSERGLTAQTQPNYSLAEEERFEPSGPSRGRRAWRDVEWSSLGKRRPHS